MVRINRYLSRCNLGSRRYVETLIQSGKISINGETCYDLSRQIDPASDKVLYQAKEVKQKRGNLYIMLNKPVNYLVTAKDDFGRKTVFELLPDEDLHLFPIGRLDLKSEGLLLLTSDGDFANEIMHPRYKLPKVYKVSVKGSINKNQIEQLRQGVEIDGRKTLPARVYIKNRKSDQTQLRIVIREGRKRQIRKMISFIGSEVIRLKRTQIGKVKLGDLPSGRWRYLTNGEIRSLRSAVKE